MPATLLQSARAPALGRDTVSLVGVGETPFGGLVVD